MIAFRALQIEIRYIFDRLHGLYEYFVAHMIFSSSKFNAQIHNER